MLHNFNLKIVHHLGFKHINASVLNKNRVDNADDDDFQKEIQDYGWM